MTREEARQVLQEKIDNRPLFKDEREAFAMAIEALQTDLVLCKDCIHQKFYINDNESFHCDQSGVVNMHMEDGDGEFFCKYGERREP